MKNQTTFRYLLKRSGKEKDTDDYQFKSSTLWQNAELLSSGETVEKVPKQILGGDAGKNDFTECATINDLTITKGHETPQNQALSIPKGFSTVSEESSRIF